MTPRVTSVDVGLVGRSISGSKSPEIHEREAAACHIPLTYSLVDFDQLGLDDAAVEEVLNSLVGKEFAGVNVTYPFKQKVMPFLDQIDPQAAAVGAVNTVIFKDGVKTGYNTDWFGFDWMLDHEFPGCDMASVAQFGAGGAGSAIAYTILQKGAEVLSLVDPNHEQALALVTRLKAVFPDADIRICDTAEKALEGASGIAQASPIGMDARPGMPFDPTLLRPGQWLADIIYFPRRTALVKAASSLGLKAAGGAAMVVGQAAKAFELFTGQKPDINRMMRDFDESLKAQAKEVAS